MFTTSAIPVYLALLVALSYLTVVSDASDGDKLRPRQKRFLIFPRANPQRLQLIGGFGIPADIQLESITMGYVFKSVYLLPWNSSHWIPPFLDRHEFETERQVRRRRETAVLTKPLVLLPSPEEQRYERYDGRWQELDSESLSQPSEQPGSLLQQHSRWTFYRLLEQLFEQKGFNGRSCVLRAICEASEARFSHTSGLIGELLHIAFTPSATDDPVGEPHHTVYRQAETIPTTISAKSGQSVCADIPGWSDKNA
uniref:Uncharacterized protein n=1 Tax=Anopheles christyi TaxID=43041 RepID=A0A182JTB6_9DIPT